MITLSDPAHTLDFTMTATVTNAVELVFAYVDVSFVSPGSYVPAGGNSSSSATGPTTLISAPAASTQRQVKYLSIFNADTAANTFQFQLNVSGTRRTIRKVTLATLESLVWDGVTWKTYTSAGAEKIDTGAAGSGTSPNLFTSNQLRTLGCELTVVNGNVTSSGVGYFCYLGQVATAITVKFVEFVVSAAGVGAQTAEIGLFSTPSAPNKANQSLTKLAATATVDSLLTTGIKRNTVSLAQSVSASTHLWAGIRIAMATTQPQALGLAADYAQGQYLTIAAPGVLTGAGPFAGVIVPADLTAQWRVPDLRATLD